MKIYNIDYAEDYLPKKISMRKIEYNSGKIKQNYHLGFNNKLRIFYAYLNNLLKNSIGKSFDSIFSKFCKNIPEYISYVNTRTIFKDCFIEYKTIRNYISYYDTYTIDKNGCIQYYCERRKTPRNDIEIRTDNYHYEINPDIFLKYYNLNNLICKILGEKEYFSIKLTNKIDKSKYRKLINIIDRHHYKLHEALKKDNVDIYYGYIYSFIFKKIYDEPTQIIQRGTKEFKRFYKEKSDKDKKEQRNKEQKLMIEYEENLRKTLEIRKNELKQNLIDRDRLGFDDNSFKKDKEK